MILNAIGGAGGGSSGFEVVASETITTTSSTSPYVLYMNIPLTDYAAGDILYIKRQGAPSYNYTYSRVCTSIGDNIYSGYIETNGICWFGPYDEDYALMIDYFAMSGRGFPKISKDSDSVTYIETTDTSYRFDGTYDIVLLRPTA